MPPVNIQFLSGGDKVDKWSDQEIWDEILGIKDNDHAVVVSTHQVSDQKDKLEISWN